MNFRSWCVERGETEETSDPLKFESGRAAAENWAREFDCRTGEYPIAKGESVTVLVRRVDVEDCPAIRYIVDADCAPQYYAHLMTVVP